MSVVTHHFLLLMLSTSGLGEIFRADARPDILRVFWAVGLVFILNFLATAVLWIVGDAHRYRRS
jgi:hypothetical protein